MGEYTGFVIILASGLFFSEIFKRLHLPYVVALIVAGIIIGPLGFNLIQLNPAIIFLGSVGAVFVMFMAGMEVRTDLLRRMRKELVVLVIMNGGIPAIIGFSIAYLFGYQILTSMILATIFISSSIAVIIPTLEEKNLLCSDIGSIIIGATIINDLSSLFLLSIVLQSSNPTTFLPLPIFVVVVALSALLLKWALPRLENRFFAKRTPGLFEEEFQFILIVTIGVTVFFEFLGVHAIVAGFLVGLILAETIKSHKIESKLHAISYGLFIPIFLLEIGIETDLTVLLSVSGAVFLMIAVVVGLIASKLLSGYFAGRLIGLEKQESFLVGAASTPQLSTSLAVAFTALEIGFIDSSLQVSIVMLSIITVLIAPIMIGFLVPKNNAKQKEEIVTEPVEQI
jgi:Kef-type K+ transport system membrane component KefB